MTIEKTSRKHQENKTIMALLRSILRYGEAARCSSLHTATTISSFASSQLKGLQETLAEHCGIHREHYQKLCNIYVKAL
jgi:hypothetical protein